MTEGLEHWKLSAFNISTKVPAFDSCKVINARCLLWGRKAQCKKFLTSILSNVQILFQRNSKAVLGFCAGIGCFRYFSSTSIISDIWLYNANDKGYNAIRPFTLSIPLYGASKKIQNREIFLNLFFQIGFISVESWVNFSTTIVVKSTVTL